MATPITPLYGKWPISNEVLFPPPLHRAWQTPQAPVPSWLRLPLLQRASVPSPPRRRCNTHIARLQCALDEADRERIALNPHKWIARRYDLRVYFASGQHFDCTDGDGIQRRGRPVDLRSSMTVGFEIPLVVRLDMQTGFKKSHVHSAPIVAPDKANPKCPQ